MTATSSVAGCHVSVTRGGASAPVAVSAAMLMGLGFSPLSAAGLSLIANTAPVAFGALGTPVIALAAVIFGGWTLKGTIAGALVFGFFSALGSVFQALGFQANAQLLVALPFIMALATMLIFAGRSRQPAALARPFVRGLT